MKTKAIKFDAKFARSIKDNVKARIRLLHGDSIEKDLVLFDVYDTIDKACHNMFDGCNYEFHWAISAAKKEQIYNLLKAQGYKVYQSVQDNVIEIEWK